MAKSGFPQFPDGMTRHSRCEALVGRRDVDKEVSDCDQTVLCLEREAQLLQEHHQNSTQCGAGGNTKYVMCFCECSQ